MEAQHIAAVAVYTSLQAIVAVSSTPYIGMAWKEKKATLLKQLSHGFYQPRTSKAFMHEDIQVPLECTGYVNYIASIPCCQELEI